MTFNIIADGDPGLASTAMQNWRHVNYGNALMPVTATGASVDSTIDIGSSYYYFKDAYIDNGYFKDSLGIGTNAPNLPLDVQANSGGNTISLRGRDNAGIDDNLLKFLKYDGTTLQGAIYALSDEMRFRDATSADVMTIKAGNVGIDNTSPGTIKDSSYTAKLQIGDGTTVDMVASIKAGTNGDGLISFENDAQCYTAGINGTADTFDIYDETADATRLSIDSSGNTSLSGFTALGSGNTAIKVKIVDIGTWDMDTALQKVVSIPAGIVANIVSVQVLIREDGNSTRHPLLGANPSAEAGGDYYFSTSFDNIYLNRTTGGKFDNSSHNDTAASYNRGWITITYIE